LSKIFLSSWTWPRAAQNSFACRMRPTGHVFEAPGLCALVVVAVASPLPSTHRGILACDWTCSSQASEFAFTVQVIHKINSRQILGFVLTCLYFTTGHVHTCVLWRALETCCRPWTWWCNDATALAGYAILMMMSSNSSSSHSSLVVLVSHIVGQQGQPH